MRMANTGALTSPGPEGRGRKRFAQARRELRQRDVQIDQRQQTAAGETHGIRDHRQQRQRDDERQHPRHHQQLDRIHAHGAQRVGFLVELHDPDLGGKGAARAARHDDGGQQHAHLAQCRDGHQIDHENIGAETRQLLRAEVGHDHADEKCDQRDDRNGGDAGFVDMPRQRRDSPGPRPRECLADHGRDAPEKHDHAARMDALQHRPAPQLADQTFQASVIGLTCSYAACRSTWSFCSRSRKCGGLPAWLTCSGGTASAKRRSSAQAGLMPGVRHRVQSQTRLPCKRRRQSY